MQALREHSRGCCEPAAIPLMSRMTLAKGSSSPKWPLCPDLSEGAAIMVHSERNLICTKGVSSPEMVWRVGRICASASFQLVTPVGGT